MHILFCGFANFLKVIYRIFFKEDIFHKIISLMQKKAGYKYQLSRGMTHVNKSRQPRKSKIWLTISSLSSCHMLQFQIRFTLRQPYYVNTTSILYTVYSKIIIEK